MAKSKHDIIFNHLSSFVNMTCVTREFTDRCCHTTHPQPRLHHLDNPPTLPLAPKHKLHVHFIGFGVGMESFLWWFCPQVSSDNYFLYIHTTTHDSQSPLSPMYLWELDFQHKWLPMDLVGCMAPKTMWKNAVIVYDHPQLLQSPPNLKPAHPNRHGSITARFQAYPTSKAPKRT